MAKEHVGRTKATATKTLYAVMKEISRRGGSMPAKELYPFVEANVKLTEWELEPAGKNKYIRWTNSFQFYSINYAKAGLIVKQKGMWYLTPEGEAALKLSPEEVMEKGEVAYREWRKLNPREDKRDEEPTDENAERDRAEELNLLESDAREGIRQFIIAKSPYEFQDMVAAHLRAMGYHTPFIAPKGKDGGIDIIAYLDPLGAQTPRIKIQKNLWYFLTIRKRLIREKKIERNKIVYFSINDNNIDIGKTKLLEALDVKVETIPFDWSKNAYENAYDEIYRRIKVDRIIPHLSVRDSVKVTFK